MRIGKDAGRGNSEETGGKTTTQGAKAATTLPASAAASYMYMNIYSVRERLTADNSYYLPK
jgi:hypothetical protein